MTTTQATKLPRRKTSKVRPLFDGAEWTFDLIRKVKSLAEESGGIHKLKQLVDILDLGCGTGKLTKAIADAGAQVVGIDNSPAMVETARAQYPELEFFLADATSFSFPHLFDAVFSNAVLHWVMNPDEAVKRIVAALRPGGRFVAEFGGKGNVAGIAGTLRAELRQLGLEYPPWWYYPTIGEYAGLLERHGLEVQFATLFNRLTKLEEGPAGLRNWIEMFRGEILKELTPALKEQVLASVEDKLRDGLFKDGSWYADYRRIRVVAVKDN